MTILDLRTTLAAAAAVALALPACDPGQKSVSGTASADDGDDGDGGDDGGSGDAGDDDWGGTGMLPGDGGDDGGSDGGDGGLEPQCLETETVLTGPDEVTPLGFAASELVAISDGWSTTMYWTTDNGGIDVVPEGTTVQLDLGMSYLGGEIRYVESMLNPNAPNQDGLFDCLDRVEMEIEVIVRSADGRLDEQFITVGTAYDATALEFRQRFETDGFAGTFSAAEVTFPDDNGLVEAFELGGIFTFDKPWTGALMIEIRQWLGDDPEDAFIGFGPIANWPADGGEGGR